MKEGKMEENRKIIQERGRAIINSEWFVIATTVLSIVAPCASVPLTASKGLVLPRVGKVVKYAPVIMSGLMNLK